MWHEARKQEKKIRGMLVDYKRRAERRREYYEKIKQDPTQFIQIHGRSCKIHLDPAVHYAAEAPGSMMPWRGDRESMIDRFDVRAHLDDIPPFNPNFSLVLTPEELWEERQSNYERYRILVQNEFLGVREEKFLNQIRLEELYGPVGNRAIEEEKKSLMPKKAAIGFNYDEIPVMDNSQINWPSAPADEPEDSGEDSDSDIDLDLTVDVLSLTNEQQMEMNTSGVEYGLNKGDFMALISRDLEEAEALRVAKEHEDEKAMFSGRKSRKERRALKKKHLDKKLSPPSYAARASPTYSPHHRLLSHSKSKSASPPCGTSQIKFITCFGEESEGGGSDIDGSSGVILIPEAEKSARSGHHRRTDRKIELSSTSSSSLRRNRNRHRTSSSSRDRSRSVSGNRSSSRRHHPSRSSSRRRSRSRSRHEGSRYISSHSNRRSESYNRNTTKRPKMRSRSRSRSLDRRQRSQYSRRYRSSKSKSYSPLRSRSKSFRSRSRSSTKRREPQTSNRPDSKLSSVVQEDGKGVSPPPRLPSPPRRRYYGRRAENSNSDADSCAEESGEPVSNSAINKGSTAADQSSSSLFTSASFGNDSSTDKVFSAGSKLTPKERLRKKMQALLKKQYKADKKLEKERAEKAEQERQDREDELREIAIKLRRREREKRHRLHGDDSESDDSHESRSSSLSSVSKSGRNRERTPTLEKETDRLIERSRSDRGTYSRSHTDRADSREKGRDRGGDNYRSSERERPFRSHERENGKPPRDNSYRDSRKFSGSRSRDDGRESHRNHSRNPTLFSSSRSNIEDEDTRLSEDESRPIRLVDY